MNRDDYRPRPGALAAALKFYGTPERPSPLELRHKPTCASHRGRSCDCNAALELQEGECTFMLPTKRAAKDIED